MTSTKPNMLQIEDLRVTVEGKEILNGLSLERRSR